MRQHADTHLPPIVKADMLRPTVRAVSAPAPSAATARGDRPAVSHHAEAPVSAGDRAVVVAPTVVAGVADGNQPVEGRSSPVPAKDDVGLDNLENGEAICGAQA